MHFNNDIMLSQYELLIIHFKLILYYIKRVYSKLIHLLIIIIVTFKPPANTHTHIAIFREENGQDWNKDKKHWMSKAKLSYLEVTQNLIQVSMKHFLLQTDIDLLR